MSEIFTLSDDIIQAAKEKIINLKKEVDESIILEKPFSNFRVVSAKEEPKNSFYKFAPEDYPKGVDFNENSVYIVSDSII